MADLMRLATRGISSEQVIGTPEPETVLVIAGSRDQFEYYVRYCVAQKNGKQVVSQRGQRWMQVGPTRYWHVSQAPHGYGYDTATPLITYGTWWQRRGDLDWIYRVIDRYPNRTDVPECDL